MCSHEPETYDYSTRMTVGGPTGQYQLVSPWDTAAEVCIIGASFGDAGGIGISTDNPSLPAANVSTVINDGGVRGTMLATPAAQYVTLPALWEPMNTPRLYLTVAVANARSALVMVQFRRPRSAAIPRPFAPFSVHPDDEHIYHRERARIEAEIANNNVRTGQHAR